MDTVAILTAPAKVNLYLDILGVLPNGYHELRTLFHPLREPADTLEVRPGLAGEGCRVDSGLPGLDGPDNLIVKAWQRFAEATGFAPDLRVRLTKRIPMGAGLGGGSSDAAAMLAFLNARAAGQALSPEDLAGLAAGIGADTPFFLLGVPAWAGGIGETLTPAQGGLEGLSLVLACPEAYVSTPWAYAAWDRRHLDGTNVLTAESGVAMGSLFLERLTLYNAFERVVFERWPGLRVIKEKLFALGACGAAMSGSGASVFGLFRDRARAEMAARSLEAAAVPAHVNHF